MRYLSVSFAGTKHRGTQRDDGEHGAQATAVRRGHGGRPGAGGRATELADGYGSKTVGAGNLAIRGAGSGATVLQAASGDLWTVPANSSFVSFEDLTMISASGAGHLFNAATASLSFWSWRRCQLIQANDAKCIWYTSGGTFINCTISDRFLPT